MSEILPKIEALGTVWWIEIFEDSNQVIFNDLVAFIKNYEERYSRFIATSLVSKLNNEKRLENPDQDFIEILKYGQNLYVKTEGLFNFLLGEVLEKTGYDSKYSFKLDNSPTEETNPLNDLIITNDLITLKKGRIDLGGFGKGYLIDLLAQKLKDEYHLKYFLINGGGDIYATSDNERPIVIYLEHPTEVNTYIETTTLLNQGFAASSPHKRKWKIGDKTYSHIVGNKEEIILDGTFIKAKTACEADAFATTTLLLKPNEIIDFANKNNFEVAFITDNATNLTYSRHW